MDMGVSMETIWMDRGSQKVMNDTTLYRVVVTRSWLGLGLGLGLLKG